jgi:molecular chaperone DnaK
MVKDAEANAAEDKKRKELVEAKNHGESLIHTTNKSLTELGDKIPAADKSTIEAAVADLKSAMEGSDAEAIKDKTNALAQAAMKLGEALYKAQSQQAGEGSGANAGDSGGQGGADDVVDADFTEVKDDDSKKSA